MNAKFLEKLIAYRITHQLNVANVLLTQKVIFQYSSLKSKKISNRYTEEIQKVTSIDEIFLIEARAARAYWKIISSRLNGKIVWRGRRPHGDDLANKLLDIGYHYLTQRLIFVFKEMNIPTELGFLHSAQSAHAHPLVYDFVEWLRPVVVDRVFVKMIRKKKNKLEKIDEKITKYFVYKIKKEMEKLYFHRKLGYCVSLDYWCKLIALEFMKCVNSDSTFRPIFPSLRNETRCKKNRRATSEAVCEQQ